MVSHGDLSVDEGGCGLAGIAFDFGCHILAGAGCSEALGTGWLYVGVSAVQWCNKVCKYGHVVVGGGTGENEGGEGSC